MSELESLKKALDRERTARKQAEKILEDKSRELYEQNQTIEQQREQLIHSEKMASVGQLAAGIAHEINNPIGFSISNVNSLQDYIKDLSEIIKIQNQLVENCANSNLETELVQKIKELNNEKELDYLFKDSVDLLHETKDGLDRVKKIVLGMKTFAHASEAEMTPQCINQCIRDADRLTNNIYKYHCRMELDLEPSLPYVNCLPDQITQVIVNAITNAAQAIEKDGHIKITTYSEGKNVVVTIEDNGGGIPKDALNKIFDPFFTTKPVGVGTGLGLSISFNIVDAHGGNIKATSQEGKGTKFTLTLPQAKEKKGEENE